MEIVSAEMGKTGDHSCGKFMTITAPDAPVHLSAIRAAIDRDDLHIPARLPIDSGETAVIQILTAMDGEAS